LSAHHGEKKPRSPGDDEAAATIRASWQMLKDRGAKTVYLGHGRPWGI